MNRNLSVSTVKLKDSSGIIGSKGTNGEIEIRFCTPDEREEYFEMKKEIVNKGRVNNKNMNDVLMNIMKHRVPFNTLVSTWDIFV